MINQYPTWKNLLVAAVVFLGVLYALPTAFGEDPAVQVAGTGAVQVDSALVADVDALLDREEIDHQGISFEGGRLLVRLADDDTQSLVRDLLRAELGTDYVVALNRAPRTPGWLSAIGARQISLGLDLRGGVHFLMQVDMEAGTERFASDVENTIRRLLRDERIRYTAIERRGDRISVTLRDADDQERVARLVRRMVEDVDVSTADDGLTVRARLREDAIEEQRQSALEQNITTLRNRVNELGVAEPIVQRQGTDRIVVQLPGVQDTAQAKEILGSTATLEFRMVHQDGDPYEAERTGRMPLGSQLYETREGEPVLLRREVIVTGDNLRNARSGFDQDTASPAAFITLDSQGARRMGRTTRENLGRPMAVVFIENRIDVERRNGELVEVERTVEEVINIATIRGVFSSRFQITGLSSPQEAQTLALLLRAGALAAPIRIIEERTVGPSLGQENIEQGFKAVVFGFLLVVLFMAVYYRTFGMVANLALFTNLFVIVALLSLLGANLTLPGIAGIVLTVGMAVDANVLIFERIREELRNGNTPQAAIHSGYGKAFSTIADANVTTLIAAVVLFSFGTGPVQGFAVTLSIGIATSMFTAILGTRAVINLIYGGRAVSKLSI